MINIPSLSMVTILLQEILKACLQVLVGKQSYDIYPFPKNRSHLRRAFTQTSEETHTEQKRESRTHANYLVVSERCRQIVTRQSFYSAQYKKEHGISDKVDHLTAKFPIQTVNADKECGLKYL
jgi:hypothetical protein